MICKQQIGRFVHFSTVFSKETWKREFCLKIAFKKCDASNVMEIQTLYNNLNHTSIKLG